MHHQPPSSRTSRTGTASEVARLVGACEQLPHRAEVDIKQHAIGALDQNVLALFSPHIEAMRRVDDIAALATLCRVLL